MRNSPSPPPSTANPIPSESLPRNPRVYRPLGIPSVSRPLKGFSPIARAYNGNASTSPSGGTSALSALKKTAYHMLSKTTGTATPAAHNRRPSPPKSPSDPEHSSRRRFASMPHPLPSAIQAQIDIDNDRRARGIASPPIVDFTRFEDTYRGPRSGNYEGLIATRKAKAGDKYGGMRSSSIGVKPPLKKTIHFDETCGTESDVAPHPAAQRKPDPRLILAALKDILGSERETDEYLDGHELLALHQLDQLDFEERDVVMADFQRTGKLQIQGRKGSLVVLGKSIREASIYSSTMMVLGGREHELPIVIVNCVEELYRTGIYQPNLFRTLPNRSRLLELINIFDSEEPPPGSVIRSRQPSGQKSAPVPGFGSQTSLHLESTPDICALLTTYLSSLPEPILSSYLFLPIWDWCGLEDDEADGNQHQESSGRRLSSIPLARTYTNPTETNHLHIAQLLLHLLPSPNFSLLVYLLAFFSQVALVREENGVGVDDLSRMFGGRIFGGGSSSLSSSTSGNVVRSGMDETVFNTTQTKREGEAMMAWFLRRWAPLSEGLFDVVDDAQMGIFRRPVIRRDSLGKDILSSPNSRPASSIVDHNESAPEVFSAANAGGNRMEEDTGDDLFQEGMGENVELRDVQSTALPRGNSDELGSGTMLPRIRINGRSPVHSTPKASSRGKGRKSKSLSPRRDGDRVHDISTEDDYVVLTPILKARPQPSDDTLDITELPSRIESQIIPSLPFDERLMDVSMPTLLNQTIPSYSSESDSTQRYPASPTTPTPTRGHGSSSLQAKLIQASERVTQLETQLCERTNSLTEALKEAARYKLKTATLARRVEDLERMLTRVRNEADRDRDAHVPSSTAASSSVAAIVDGIADAERARAEFEEKLQATEKERDSAKELVSEIKKLVVKD